MVPKLILFKANGRKQKINIDVITCIGARNDEMIVTTVSGRGYVGHHITFEL